MLLIDRYPGQSVIIRTRSGETIKVTLVSAEPGVPATIGFDAARSIIIDRAEKIFNRTESNNRGK